MNFYYAKLYTYLGVQWSKFVLLCLFDHENYVFLLKMTLFLPIFHDKKFELLTSKIILKYILSITNLIQILVQEKVGGVQIGKLKGRESTWQPSCHPGPPGKLSWVPYFPNFGEVFEGVKGLFWKMYKYIILVLAQSLCGWSFFF